jgi:hypothetical protein
MSTTFRLQHALDWAARRRDAERIASMPTHLRPTIPHEGRWHYSEQNDAYSRDKNVRMLRLAGISMPNGGGYDNIYPIPELPIGKSQLRRRKSDLK